MSKASLWGITPEGYGKCLENFSNSFLYFPAVMKILATKYSINERSLPHICDEICMAINEDFNDAICWNLVTSEIFFRKDAEKITSIFDEFAKQHGLNELHKLSEAIRKIPDDFQFFIFQGTDVASIVEDVLFDENGNKTSIFDHKNFIGNFIIIENNSIRYIENTRFRLKKEKVKKEKAEKKKTKKTKKEQPCNIFFTSDLHLNHDKDFVYADRGFTNINEMNEAIIKNFNEVVKEDDEFYILGDVCLGKDLEENKKLIERLPGKLHIIRGNHDSNSRVEMYKTCKNVVEVCDGKWMNCKNRHLYLSHCPNMGTGFGYITKAHVLSRGVLSIFGHTHQNDTMFMGNPTTYHVGVDAHNMRPISLDYILEEIEKNLKEYKMQKTTD